MHMSIIYYYIVGLDDVEKMLLHFISISITIWTFDNTVTLNGVLMLTEA